MKLFNAFLLESQQKIDHLEKTQGTKVLAALQKDRGINARRDYKTSLEVITELDSWSEKYLQWLVNRYIDGKFSIEDKYRLTSLLERFEKYKSKTKWNDINKYKSVSDLDIELEDIFVLDGNGHETSKRQEDKSIGDKFIADGDAKVFYQDSKIKVVIPKTKEASCYFGRGTKWCTAADKHNMFDSYSEQNDLYIIMPKGMEKFQLHFGDSGVQFMDSHDTDISSEKFEALVKLGIKDIFNVVAVENRYVPLYSELDIHDLIVYIYYNGVGGLIDKIYDDISEKLLFNGKKYTDISLLHEFFENMGSTYSHEERLMHIFITMIRDHVSYEFFVELSKTTPFKNILVSYFEDDMLFSKSKDLEKIAKFVIDSDPKAAMSRRRFGPWLIREYPELMKYTASKYKDDEIVQHLIKQIDPNFTIRIN